MAIGTIGALALGSAAGGVASAIGSSRAAGATQDAANAANATQRYMFDRSVALTEPQRRIGMNALMALQNELGIGAPEGIGGDDGYYWTNGQGQYRDEINLPYGEREGWTRMREASFETSPGYEFQQQQGQNAIERMAAARGLRLSGGTLRSAADYSSGLASQEYGNYLNRLAGVAGSGQTATQQQVGAGSNYANAVGRNTMAAGQARASGYMNQANALNSTIGDIAGIYTMGQMGVFN